MQTNNYDNSINYFNDKIKEAKDNIIFCQNQIKEVEKEKFNDEVNKLNYVEKVNVNIKLHDRRNYRDNFKYGQIDIPITFKDSLNMRIERDPYTEKCIGHYYTKGDELTSYEKLCREAQNRSFNNDIRHDLKDNESYFLYKLFSNFEGSNENNIPTNEKIIDVVLFDIYY